MKQATRSDKPQVLKILIKAFDEVQGMKWLVKCDEKKEKRFRALAEYMFEKAISRNGVFLSDDETGVALFYRNKSRGKFLVDLLNEIKLLIRALDIRRIAEILQRESYRKKMKPAGKDYYYFWMLGVLDEGKGRGAAYELKNALMQKADADGLPVYLETTIERNCKVYERSGFNLYHYWEVKEKNIRLWFLKRDVAVAKAF